jgi:hypothetical protein
VNDSFYWLLTLVILCLGFSIQPLRALWRKLRPSNETPLKNRQKVAYASGQRRSILEKYNVPASYLGYMSSLNNEELEEWAKAFHSVHEDGHWD